MTARKPIWSAARLNSEISHANSSRLAFTPFGDVVPLDPFTSQSMVRSADGACEFADDPTTVAEIIGFKVAGLETVASNIGVMPSYLACCAIDPESSSIVIVRPRAVDVVGPFRDVPEPLRDWLLRAAQLGHSIGLNRPNVCIHWQKAALHNQLPKIGEELPLNVSQQSGLPVFPLPDLVPTAERAHDAWLVEHLKAFDAGRLKSRVIARDDAIALAAGVWQINGFLERCHELAQSVDGRGNNRAGDYWHAIMHRREPDYSNAKYWFRRVGHHGIQAFLARDAEDVLSTCSSADASRWQSVLVDKGRQKWNSLAFVDLCEQVEDGQDAALILAARQIQLIEMVLLLQSTCHDAIA
jgi:hypothetical protein